MRFGTLFDFPDKLKALAAVEAEMKAADFWDRPEAAKETVQKLKSLKAVVQPVRQVMQAVDDLTAMAELLDEREDDDLRTELEAGLDAAVAELNRV